MDAIITYVNGADPLWLEDFRNFLGTPVMTKRYRDWGTLKYLLRGIENCMPFIDRVFLVVSRESQVPSWASDKLSIVLHKDIIPEEKLPTFNSSMIEMFLHRIPGLSERFLYFNDDMFPVSPCNENDFYVDGKATIGFARNIFANNNFRKLVRKSDMLARKALGMRESIWFHRPQHTCSPMLRSECENLYAAMETEIMASLSPLRELKNYNQYIYLDYLFYQGKAVNRRISNKHFSLAVASNKDLDNFLNCPDRKMVCINDVHMPKSREEALRQTICDAFERRFPEKSRFEKQ